MQTPDAGAPPRPQATSLRGPPRGPAITVERLRPDHLLGLRRRLQPAQAAWVDRIELGAAEQLAAEGSAFAALTGGRVVGCGGVQDRGGGRGEAWALLAEDAGPHMLGLTRVVRRYLEVAPWRRMTAFTAKDFRPARRWAESIGLRFEAELQAFCEDGSNGEQWVWLNVGI